MRLWICFACFVLILGPALLYGERLDARLLRADPDLVPDDSGLMRHGLRDGEREFAAHCSTCHGTNATGDSARGVPNLADSDWLYGQGAVSEIERVISYGIRSGNPKAWNLARMPAYATPVPSTENLKITPLDPGQVRDVIEYLYFLQHRPADPNALARGAAIYGNTGACYDCHSPDARGDPAIGSPNLVDNINLYGDGSKDALFESISIGRHGVCPAWIDRMSAVAIRDTALYVYSLSHAAIQPHPQQPVPQVSESPATARAGVS